MNDKIVGRPIRCNRKTLKVKSGKDYAEMLCVSDVHYGSPQCDVGRFLRQLEYCRKNGLYVWLGGDLLEMALRDSVGAAIYEQNIKAQSQYEQMCEWLRPLAKAGLIVGTHQGNHCERVYRSTGINIMKAMANELDVPYLGDACWNVFTVGSQHYSIYSLHGRTGARFDGTALLALERISTSFSGDAVLMAHTHKLSNSSVITQRVVGGRVKEYKKHLVLTGSYVSYDGNYSQVVGLPIPKLGSPKLKLFSKRHDISVSI